MLAQMRCEWVAMLFLMCVALTLALLEFLRASSDVWMYTWIGLVVLMFVVAILLFHKALRKHASELTSGVNL